MKLTEMEVKKVDENINLIHHILKRYAINKNDYNDCFQVGCIGLCLATQRYDERKGTEFATFAIAYINGYINTFFRDFLSGPIRPQRKDWQAKEVPQYFYLDSITVDGEEKSAHDIVELQESKEEEIIAELELERIKNKLSDRESRYIDLAMKGARQIEIGREIGVSQAQVSRIRTKIRKKVKDYIGG